MIVAWILLCRDIGLFIQTHRITGFINFSVNPGVSVLKAVLCDNWCEIISELVSMLV